MSRNNRANRKAKQRSVKIVKHNFEGGIKELLDRMKDFANAWAKKQQELESRIGQLTVYVLRELRTLSQNQAVLIESHDGMDTNVLAGEKIMREIIGRFEQVDELFRQCVPASLGIELDSELMRKRATETYANILTDALNQVKAKKAEEMKKRAEQMAAEKAAMEAAAAEAAKKAEDDKKEKETMDAALADAERPSVSDINQAGGEGAPVPEGAQVFGG